MKRDLICKRCEQKVGEIETKGSLLPKKVRLCQSCKATSLELHKQILVERNKSDELRLANSIRMSENNPMFNEEIQQKVSSSMKILYQSGELVSSFSDPEKLKEIQSKNKITEDGRRRLSDRMKTDNPMFVEEYKTKASQTFRKKVEDGEIVFKRGIEHHLWKGNRGFSDTLRVQLFPVWTKKCLERDNFTCQDCNNKTSLQVHHIKPLRNFIDEILGEYGIPNFNLIPVCDWQFYFDVIISNHKLEDGITVCKSCHSKRDKFLRINNEN
jgi:5-methylcytosine-specific restriction endonuclease McrA